MFIWICVIFHIHIREYIYVFYKCVLITYGQEIARKVIRILFAIVTKIYF